MISPDFTRGYFTLPSLIHSETALGSNFTPALPAAATTRPQLGSSPYTAVLTSGDSITVRADWFHSDLKIFTGEHSLKWAYANENATYNTAGLSVNGNGVLQAGNVTANSSEGDTFAKNAEAKCDTCHQMKTPKKGAADRNDFGKKVEAAKGKDGKIDWAKLLAV